uniref:Uncharacterized protein n=1 Tax=Arundo donax TaxID=35708 RepID=A0A0A9AP76_ARUDO
MLNHEVGQKLQIRTTMATPVNLNHSIYYNTKGKNKQLPDNFCLILILRHMYP